MEVVNYYIPSESQLLLNPETSYMEVQICQFQLETEDNALFLRILTASATKSMIVPADICQDIIDRNKQNRLTNAYVNQVLYPVKSKLLQQIPLKDDMINLSQLLYAATGYSSKNNMPVAIFAAGAMRMDVFKDIYSLCFTLSLNDTSKILLISSEEHIMRDQERVVFTFIVDDVVYKAIAVSKNRTFQLQQITKNSEMQYRELFQNNEPLNNIYNKFTAKKSRLSLLRHK